MLEGSHAELRFIQIWEESGQKPNQRQIRTDLTRTSSCASTGVLKNGAPDYVLAADAVTDRAADNGAGYDGPQEYEQMDFGARLTPPELKDNCYDVTS